MKPAIFAAIFVCVVTPAIAGPSQLPPGVTCEVVRAKVAEHGKVYAYAWARLQGYTTAQINEAKKCIR